MAAGQLKPGDFVRFALISYRPARALTDRVDSFVHDIEMTISSKFEKAPSLDLSFEREEKSGAILRHVQGDGAMRLQAIYRHGGDCFILLDLGESELGYPDHCSYTTTYVQTGGSADSKGHFGPYRHSLNIRYDPNVIEQSKLLDISSEAEASIQAAASTKIPTPSLAWDSRPP